jgi:hypothetical protein
MKKLTATASVMATLTIIIVDKTGLTALFDEGIASNPFSIFNKILL